MAARWSLLVISAFAGWSQDASQGPATQPAPKASVSGYVLQAGAALPLMDVVVTIDSGKIRARTKTDDKGAYTFSDLPGGAYTVRAQKGAVAQVRVVQLLAGQALRSIDFILALRGEITGRILDHDREPLPGTRVQLIRREYQFGRIRYLPGPVTTSNARGEYHFAEVAPGRSFLILAGGRSGPIPAISVAPAEPEARIQTVVPTFYGGATSVVSASPISVSSGGRREGVDIQLLRSTAYCMEGAANVDGKLATVDFRLFPAEFALGVFGFMTAIVGKTGPDGRLRICDLGPDEYLLVTYQASAGPDGAGFYSATPIVITNKDVVNLSFAPAMRALLAVELAWDAEPRDDPGVHEVALSLIPANGTRISGVDGRSAAKAAIPARFAFDGLRVTDYEVRVSGLTGALYIKDMTYGGSSVFHKPLRLGSGVGDEPLRIVIARDGGVAELSAVDPEGRPVPDVSTLLIPANVGSEADLSDLATIGGTDQRGLWRSPALPPGEYQALAIDGAIDRSPETMGKLWRARTSAKEVRIAPQGQARISLTPTRLD